MIDGPSYPDARLENADWIKSGAWDVTHTETDRERMLRAVAEMSATQARNWTVLPSYVEAPLWFRRAIRRRLRQLEGTE